MKRIGSVIVLEEYPEKGYVVGVDEKDIPSIKAKIAQDMAAGKDTQGWFKHREQLHELGVLTRLDIQAWEAIR